jgi:gamma-glutamyl-gamma-aminobutyrate hydrolase PuuD
MSAQARKAKNTKPVILVNTDYLDEKWKTVQISAKYPLSLEKAGAIPVLVPPYLVKSDILALLDLADGVLLIGGRDYDPRLWGEQPHEHTMLIPKVRQDFDILLMKCAMEKEIPIFGICGGHQLINIVSGGSLYTSLETQVPNALRHNSFPDLTRNNYHPVTIDVTSRLLSIIGDTTLTVNSFHHQAVKDLGNALRVTATAPDGVIEGIEGTSTPIYGVQWHPEKSLNDVMQQKLFKQFVSICLETKNQRH